MTFTTLWMILISMAMAGIIVAEILRRMDPDRCRVDTEWQGSFIGRKRCSTHGAVWDSGGPCPRTNTFNGRPWM